jgi:hypothetical protein
LPPVPVLPDSTSKPPPTSNLTTADLLAIACEANVLKIMGERRTRVITFDFVPARPAIILPRLEGDGPLNASPPHVEEVTYYLEDTMFGGEVYAAVTCRGHTVVAPFLWSSWEALARSRIRPY